MTIYCCLDYTLYKYLYNQCTATTMKIWKTSYVFFSPQSTMGMQREPSGLLRNNVEKGDYCRNLECGMLISICQSLLTCRGNKIRCTRCTTPQRMFQLVYPLHREIQISLHLKAFLRRLRVSERSLCSVLCWVATSCVFLTLHSFGSYLLSYILIIV